MIQDVQSKKKPLQGHLPDLYRVRPLKELLESERLEADHRRVTSLEDVIRKAFQSSQARLGAPVGANFESRSGLTHLVCELKSHLEILSTEVLDVTLEKLMA